MRVHCLGTTGYHPSSTRHTACYYLPDQALVLDAGTGLFRLIECLRLSPKRSLDILLSHAHLDHVVGLTFLVDAMAITPLEQVRVFGEQDKLEAVKQHIYNELIFPVSPTFEFVELPHRAGRMPLETPGTVGRDQVTLEWFPLDHPGGALGFIIECGDQDCKTRVAYVTDTTARANSSYIERLTKIDLLLHECYFNDEQHELAEKTGHSCLSDVIDVVRRCRPARTALIHINPLSELLSSPLELDSEHAQQLKIQVAEDGMLLDASLAGQLGS